MDRRQPSKRQLCLALLLTAAAALPLAASPPVAETPAEPQACTQLAQWAVDNRHSLPSDYRGMLAYPLHERRAIFNTLTPQQKADFWRDRIEHYLQENPGLSERQMKAIAEGAALLTPGLYATLAKPESPRKASIEGWVDEVIAQVRAGLGDQETRDLFYRLGPASGAEKAAAPVTANDPCDCWLVSDCEWPVNYCDTFSGCWQTPGCGPGGTRTCRGTCTIPPVEDP